MLEAVVHGEGPLLILAGAGSGKTRVITRRIAWQVAACGVAPDEILAELDIKMTRGELNEMLGRLGRYEIERLIGLPPPTPRR